MKYAAYSQYKPSGVEWLDVIPSHWMVKSARFGYSIQLGKMLQPEPSSTLDAETPYLKSQHVQWELVRVDDLPLMWASPSELIKYGIQDGDLLVCEGGDVGRAGIIQNTPQGTIIQNALHRVRPRKQHDICFLMYVLEHASGQSWFDIICNRSTIAHFTGEKFGALRVPAPPLDEQQAIARFLDAKTAQIDALVAQKRQLIDKLKEKRQALIARTVTRGLPPEAAKAAGLEPNPEMKDSGVEWLAQIPTHWRLRPLKRIVSIPITDGPHETPEFPLDGVPFVSAEAVKDGRVLLSSMRGYISREDHERYSRKYFPRKRDIFIVKSGSTTGKVAIVDFDDEFNVWSPLAAVRCDLRKALPEFVLYALSSEYFQGLVQVSWSFGTQPNIGMGVIGNLAVVLPPIFEQRLIAEFLGTEVARMNGLIDQAQTAIDRLTEYRQALITSAVTGKIDVRNWQSGLEAA